MPNRTVFITYNNKASAITTNNDMTFTRPLSKYLLVITIITIAMQNRAHAGGFGAGEADRARDDAVRGVEPDRAAPAGRDLTGAGGGGRECGHPRPGRCEQRPDRSRSGVVAGIQLAA